MKVQDLMAYISVSERTKLSREGCQLLDEYLGQRSWKRSLNYIDFKFFGNRTVPMKY